MSLEEDLALCTRKDWYSVKASSIFHIRDVEKTRVSRTTGLKNADDAFEGTSRFLLQIYREIRGTHSKNLSSA